jgi:hypothetical protein
MTMADESSPFGSSQWPQWMLNVLWDGGIIPRGSRQIPAYTALDWQQSPNGGLTARPDPLWNHTSGHWLEPFLPKRSEAGTGGLLGHRYDQSDEPPWFDPGPELKGTIPLPDWVRPVSAEELFTGRPTRSPQPPASEPDDSGTGGLLGKRYANWPGSASYAAIGRDAPVREVPVIRQNPFDFSRTMFSDMQRRYLWNKLLYDSKLLPNNPFFMGTYDDPTGLLGPTPMNPAEGAPILPPDFR